MAEKTIPLLPCQSTLLPTVVEFYTALGFTTTFRQDKPYAYAVVERGDVELQFYGLKEYDPASSYSGCYVLTDDVDALHTAFRAGLKAAYGRIPSRGLPRIGPLKDMSYGVRQFLVTDPTGNSLRIGQQISEDQHHSPTPKERYARALHQAELYADSKEDLPGAARIIDRALERADGEGGTEAGPTPVQLLRLLVLRGDVAQRQGEAGLAEELLARAAGVPLTDEERAGAQDVLTRLAELTE
ncbi:bleomycin resistance protein [Streptomyces sp. NPDC017979]|uniref:bleomycin resistance protein n=1 Tax=Streptomyces sp. NPDC017979 TaxID=3365024 RepID=UPI0037B6AC0A